MVFFYLTNAALDISLGVVWWSLKQTTYFVYNGVTYVLYGTEENKDVIIMNELADLKKEIKSLKMIKND